MTEYVVHEESSAASVPRLGVLLRRMWTPRRMLLLLAGLLVLVAAIAVTRPGGLVNRRQMRMLLPVADQLAADQIRLEFRELRYQPTADPSLAFHVLTPKAWTERRLDKLSSRRQGEDRVPVLLTAMEPSGRDDALLEFSYLHLQKPSSLRQLLDGYARNLGARIVARQPGSFNNRQVEDCLLRWNHPKLGMSLSRVTLSRHGEMLMIVSGSARESSYPEFRQIFGVAAVSFSSLSSAALNPQS